MEGWWCVRYGDALAWVEAPTGSEAVQRSLELHPLGDWTDDARELTVFPQDEYPNHSGRRDYTRAVLSTGAVREQLVDTAVERARNGVMPL